MGLQKFFAVGPDAGSELRCTDCLACIPLQEKIKYQAQLEEAVASLLTVASASETAWTSTKIRTMGYILKPCEAEHLKSPSGIFFSKICNTSLLWARSPCGHSKELKKAKIAATVCPAP